MSINVCGGEGWGEMWMEDDEGNMLCWTCGRFYPEHEFAKCFYLCEGCAEEGEASSEEALR